MDHESEFRAPGIPGLARLIVTATQRNAAAEASITVIDQLESITRAAAINAPGLPGYNFERAAGEPWRRRFDAPRNIVVVNSEHRDFFFATRNRALQLHYLLRLDVKELVLGIFAGLARSVACANDRAVAIRPRDLDDSAMALRL